MDYITHYDSILGKILIAADGRALVGLWFEGQKHAANVLDTAFEERPDLPIFHETCRWLDNYFSGTIPDFTPALLLRGSDFRRRVWHQLLEIPYGRTLTYGELASRLDCKSAQAVGGAVGHNNISLIIPCHRVIGADGSLTGYGGGIDRKRYLLELEGLTASSLAF